MKTSKSFVTAKSQLPVGTDWLLVLLISGLNGITLGRLFAGSFFDRPALNVVAALVVAGGISLGVYTFALVARGRPLKSLAVPVLVGLLLTAFGLNLDLWGNARASLSNRAVNALMGAFGADEATIAARMDAEFERSCENESHSSNAHGHGGVARDDDSVGALAFGACASGSGGAVAIGTQARGQPTKAPIVVQGPEYAP